MTPGSASQVISLCRHTHSLPDSSCCLLSRVLPSAPTGVMPQSQLQPSHARYRAVPGGAGPWAVGRGPWAVSGRAGPGRAVSCRRRPGRPSDPRGATAPASGESCTLGARFRPIRSGRHGEPRPRRPRPRPRRRPAAARRRRVEQHAVCRARYKVGPSGRSPGPGR